MANVSIDATVVKFESFVNDILKEDLRLLELRLQQINGELADLIQQRHVLKVTSDKKAKKPGFKTQLNLGCNFFMEAVVPDTSTLLVNVGLNHFLEFGIDEANKYLDLRIKANEKKSEDLQQNVAKTKAHIKVMLIKLAELQNERMASSKPKNTKLKKQGKKHDK